MLLKTATLALLAAAIVPAQLLPPKVINPIGPPPVQPGPIPPPPPDSILGFETSTSWFVGSISAATRVALTNIRTQGHFAFALSNPASQTTLNSQTVGSATALAGAGDVGAIFELDVFPGAQLPSGTSLKLSLTSPLRQLNNVEVAEVSLDGLHTGIYNTLQFAIPDSVRTSLGADIPQDLSFRLQLTMSNASAFTPEAQILFDNLRVHSVPLVTATTTRKAPAGYGGTIDLVADGATPVSQSFTAAAVQVPDSFHLTQGTAGNTTVALGLGHDGTAAFTCTYHPDSTDTNGHTYRVNSCTGGVQAGDLVGASFAQLTIVGGTSLMEVRAQLAKNPVGDLVGRGVIPPMPTFWGDIGGCTPAPLMKSVISTTQACTNQAAQINQIVTDYFNKVNDANVAPNYIVTGVPEFAQRHGDGSPHNNLTTPHLLTPDGSAQTGQADMPFDQNGHINPGGSFDAYWDLNGDLSTNSTPDSGSSSGIDSTMNLNASFDGHVVVFGQDVTIASVQANAQSTSGSSPSASGSYQVVLFGNTIAGGNLDATTGFSFGVSQSQEFDLPPIQIWFFEITVGATGSVGINASGSLAPTGFNVSLTPEASVGVHIFGGVSVGIASGGVDVRIDLVDVSAPITAQAGFFSDNSPQFCDLTMKSSLTGKVNISSGGGEVDLEVSIGPCPFCVSDSFTLFSWAPIASYTTTLFDIPLAPNFVIPLPTGLCAHPLSVTIVQPTGTVLDKLQQSLVASVSGSDGNATCTWTGFAGNDQQPNPQGCSASAQFTNLGQRTLTVTATDAIPSTFGRTITETGSATITFNVVDLPPGVYIIGTSPAPDFPCSFSSDGSPSFGCTPHPQTFNDISITVPEFNFPANIVLFGEVTLPIANTTTSWTATDSSGNMVTLKNPPCLGPACDVAPILGGNPNQVSVTWGVAKPDTYTITMTTKDSTGKVVGTATTSIFVPNGRTPQ